jgi:beta-glucosidase/6-phospho-beta-glucosidase/beta-galactosidase
MVFRAASKWLYVVPYGIRRVIKWVRDRYGDIPMYVTENGYSDSGTLDDEDRADYYRQYINQVLRGLTHTLVD